LKKRKRRPNDIQFSLRLFAIIEEAKENMTNSFIPSRYVSQKELIESFEKNVLKPARKAAGLKQT
jgi:hypothetical protein